VLIVGFGSIASQLATVLKALGAHVRGIARSAGIRAGCEILPIAEIFSVLPSADVVISLMPYSAESEKFFNQEFFNGMKNQSIFINVGRGKTVDEDALVEALESNKIRKAAIDVTFDEPLAAESPLWKCQNLFITPHISGGRPLESEQLILANAENILLGKEIINLVAH
jgi:phosphoglycerate dehydrogenase-like enzyme